MSARISKEVREIGAKISSDEKSDLVLYNGPINESGIAALVENLDKTQNAIILVLVTNGGSPNSAFRIARFLQSAYDTFTVFVTSYCKSAGTLIALGANRLIMSVVSELGPLDVQLYKRDEIGERRSSLSSRSALTTLNERAESLFSHLLVSIKRNSENLIRFKLASELAAQMTVGLMSPVYGQVAPESLGEDYQDLMVAHEYGKRLAAVGGLVSEAAVYRLVHDYPSHDFVIDPQEAATLFSQVDSPTPDMYDLVAKLGALAFKPDRKIVTVQALSKPIGETPDEINTGPSKNGDDGTEPNEGSSERGMA